MNISRTFAIALVGLSLGLFATSANAGILRDSVKGVGKVAAFGVGKALGLDGIVQASAAARKQNEARTAMENDKSQFAWLGNKEYVACLQKDTARNCNLKIFGVEKITKR